MVATRNGALNTRRDPYMAYNFLVEIEGLIAGGFREVTGLESEIQLESYQEGGRNSFTYQFPTRVSFPNLVLSRGLTDADTFWNWYRDTTQGNIKLRNGTIMLQNAQQSTVMRWNFANAYPVKWSGPQLNATNVGEVAVERIELVHQGISRQ